MMDLFVEANLLQFGIADPGLAVSAALSALAATFGAAAFIARRSLG